MGLHAEVLALRNTLGISYKDACHRLYMTQWEKLKTDERTKKAFSTLKSRTQNAIVHFQVKFGQVGLQEASARQDTQMRDADADPHSSAAPQ
jgi:hypothetical protein